MTKIAALALACVAGIAPAAAQDLCLGRSALSSHLEEHYSEQPAATGLEARGTMVEVFVSPHGTWTIVATTPKGVSCIRAAGKGWTRISVRSSGEPPPWF